jgi:hypothetical protein
MALSIFDDKLKIPEEKDLIKVLEKTYKQWNEIKEFLAKEYSEVKEEWKYVGKNYGWGFRLRDDKRVIVYLTPCEGYFKFSILFGGTATTEALSSDISRETKTNIESSKVYAEGRGIRIDVKDGKLIKDIEKLILIKLSH